MLISKVKDNYFLRKIQGIDFGKTVGREKRDFIAPRPNPNRDILEELIDKIKAKHDRVKLRDSLRTKFKPKRMKK